MNEVYAPELLCEQRSYEVLKERLHPDGMACPNGHPLPDDQSPHNRLRAPLVAYRCRTCGAVFNLFTGTAWCGTHFDCPTVLLMLRGFEQGVPPKTLAQVVGVSYSSLIRWRRRLIAACRQGIATGLQISDADQEAASVLHSTLS